jgi:hypothetical protein
MKKSNAMRLPVLQLEAVSIQIIHGMERREMNYLSGITIEIGDSVLLEYGKTPGFVCAVIESPEQIDEWALDEPGIMIEAELYGLVFWPESETRDPAIFIMRKCT